MLMWEISSLLRSEYRVHGVMVGGEVEKGCLSLFVVKALCVIIMSLSFLRAVWKVSRCVL